MKITTKYDVGYCFLVPRSYKKTKLDTLTWEGEIWTKTTHSYEAIVKQKEIIKINVDVNTKGSPSISYYVVDKGDYNQMSQVYLEHQITDYTEETALALAESHRDAGKEYFGN
jgi:hypothetical protein